MGISIKNDEVECAAHELAALTGQSVTAAIGEALDEALARRRDGTRMSGDEKIARIREIQADVAKIPVLDPRSIREIRDEISDESAQ